MLKVWKKGQPVPEGMAVQYDVIEQCFSLYPLTFEEIENSKILQFISMSQKSYADLCVDLLKKDGE